LKNETKEEKEVIKSAKDEELTLVDEELTKILKAKGTSNKKNLPILRKVDKTIKKKEKKIE
jgi:hypothetical protein